MTAPLLPGTAATTVDVLIPLALDTAYSYRVPALLALNTGDFVTVPLGTREVTGVVWQAHSGPGGGNLKQVSAKRDLPALPDNLRKFIDWIARWTLAPRGMVLRMAMTAPDSAGPEPVRLGVRLTGLVPDRMTAARARVLAAGVSGLGFTKSALAEAAACGLGVINGMVDEGALDVIALTPESLASCPDPDFSAPQLEPSQAAAAGILRAAAGARTFSVTLLEGVTGSGKTEVYFEAVAEALRAGKQVLVMMPEIALTAQFLDRFAARFGSRPAEWHSGVQARKRARTWMSVASGDVRVVAGARSSLFLPFGSLGLIIVDEEHEGAYKQGDGVTYHARDMAVVRGQIEAAPVILASATPSIETRVNALAGRYQHVRLDNRFGGRALPRLAAIDLRGDTLARGTWISPKLAQEVRDTLALGQQALLFLNRRGYAPMTLCRDCAHRFQCAQCSAWLVEHRFRRALVCHHCGHVERRPDACPNCEAVDSLMPCGPGVERLGEEVAKLFPDARTLVLSSDFPGGTERLRTELEEIAKGSFDIIIGTQLVAKGHNFPLLTLVGVIDADVGLANGDPRAAERTFQLLQQVTGRAGRGGEPGRGFLQTFQPDHPVIAALLSGDAEKFYVAETAMREQAALPPFGRLAALIVSGNDRIAAETHARALARAAFALPASDQWTVAPAGGLPGETDIIVLGPAEAPIAMVRGRHRFRLLVKAPRAANLQGFLRTLLAHAPKVTGNVRVAVDVEPQSFL